MLSEPKSEHKFKDNSIFEVAFEHYCFDKDLRKIIANEIEKLEVAVRAKIIYVMSLADSPFWFRNNQLFKDSKKHSECLQTIELELNRSNETFINTFKENYLNNYPPSWILMEVTSFGALSALYSNLKNSEEKTLIAKYFGLPVDVFISWLHTLVYVRNICAHHGRLWNRIFSISPKRVRKPLNIWLSKNPSFSGNVYYFLCLLKYLLNVIHPKNKLEIKLTSLLTKYPNVNPLNMGFEDNWENERLWIQEL